MIQRKQTVFIVLALISTLVCLSLPIGSLVPADRSGVALANDDLVYNLCIISGVDGAWNFKTAPLFFVLLLTCPIGTYAIFKYNNRKAFIFSAVLNIIYALNHYSQVSSKSTSALLLLGGFMLVLNAIYHKRYSLSCWLGVAEILFGSFLNYLYFFVALGFAIAFFFGDMLAKRKYRLQFQKFFWYSRPFFLMSTRRVDASMTPSISS